MGRHDQKHLNLNQYILEELCHGFVCGLKGHVASNMSVLAFETNKCQAEKSSPLLDLAEECRDLWEMWEPPLELRRRW